MQCGFCGKSKEYHNQENHGFVVPQPKNIDNFPSEMRAYGEPQPTPEPPDNRLLRHTCGTPMNITVGQDLVCPKCNKLMIEPDDQCPENNDKEFRNCKGKLLCPHCSGDITLLLSQAIADATETERKRATEYLRKICWSEQDIQAFLQWGLPTPQQELTKGGKDE